MPKHKRALPPTNQLPPDSKSIEQAYLLGLSLFSLFLVVMIVISQGQRREGLILITSIVAGLFTLFLTFRPVFKDWAGFAKSLQRGPRWWTDDYLAPHSDVWNPIPKLAQWLLLGITGAVVIFIFFHNVK